MEPRHGRRHPRPRDPGPPRRARPARPAPLRRAGHRGRGGAPARRRRPEVGGMLVTTVFELLAGPVGVGRADDLPGDWPAGLDDPAAYTPAWQQETHRRGRRHRRAGRARVRPQRRALARALDDHHGRRHQPLVPLRPDLPRDARPSCCCAAARASTAAAGRTTWARRRWPDHRLGDAGVRAGLVAAAPPAGDHPLLVPHERPVALPAHAGGRVRITLGRGDLRTCTWPTPTRSPPGSGGCPPTRASTATRWTSPTRRRPPGCRSLTTSCASSSRAACASRRRTPMARGTSRRCSRSGAQPARLLEQGPRSPAPRPRGRGRGDPQRRGAARPAHEDVVWRDEAPRASSTFSRRSTSRMNGSASTRTSCCPRPPGTRSTTSPARTCTRSCTPSTRR